MLRWAVSDNATLCPGCHRYMSTASGPQQTLSPGATTCNYKRYIVTSPRCLKTTVEAEILVGDLIWLFSFAVLINEIQSMMNF